MEALSQRSTMDRVVARADRRGDEVIGLQSRVEFNVQAESDEAGVSL